VLAPLVVITFTYSMFEPLPTAIEAPTVRGVLVWMVVEPAVYSAP
jgi:hypothetical protein